MVRKKKPAAAKAPTQQQADGAASSAAAEHQQQAQRPPPASPLRTQPPPPPPPPPPPQPQLPLAGGNDDLLPSAPPAFPQPVSSLPRSGYGGSGGGWGVVPAAATAAAVPGVVIANGGVVGLGHHHHHHYHHQHLPYGGGGGYNAGGTGVTAAAWLNGAGGAGGDGDAALLLLGDPLLGGGAPFGATMVFANRQVRHAFLRRVLSLLTLQLLLTAAVAAAVVSHRGARRFLRANPWVFSLAALAAATLLLVLAWSEQARRRRPANLLTLAALTLANGLALGAASGTYATHAPLLALLLAAAVSLALVGYASQHACDFGPPGGILFAAGALLAAVAAADAWLGFKTLQLLVAGCGALLFVSYLVADVSALAAGEGLHAAVTPNEAVFGAVNVYTDVVSAAMHALTVLTQLQGGGRDEELLV